MFLAVTGAEALYADMGHFGRKPIRLAFFALVLPALLLNYFGQGALLLRAPEAVANPFYLLAPRWFLYPLLLIATLAAIVASQALISGVFSLAQQAVQLGFSPRLTIVHTSEEEHGQIYVPQINMALMLGTLLIVAGFQSSSALGAAYGIAVTGTMAITTLLFAVVARTRWHWPLWRVVALAAFFFVFDFAFLGANLLKIMSRAGGFRWSIALGVLTLMTTWKRGREIRERHACAARACRSSCCSASSRGGRRSACRALPCSSPRTPRARRSCCCIISSTTRRCTSRSYSSRSRRPTFRTWTTSSASR